MSNSVYSLSFDAADAANLARFWAAALGQEVSPGATTESAALDPDGTSPRLSFHQVPEPKSVKNRLHLDLITTTFEAESQRLIALGASPIRDVTKGSARWTTFADPEGNEFDLIAR
jgi:Glyoxalase-like domain